MGALDVDDLVAGVLAGDRRAVGRAISLVEDGRTELEDLSAGIYARTGGAVTVGVTGAPGVGKSTLAAGLVVMAPGLGDAVQMAKAGILEVADVFVVNKHDREGAGELVRELRQMLHLGASRPWDPPIALTVATTRAGVDALWDAIEAHGTWAVETGARDVKRRARQLADVEALAA